MKPPWTDGLFLIAEAGVNHNGDAERAIALLEMGAQAGADAIKFQTFDPDALVAASTPQAEYQQVNTGKVETQLDMLRRLRLTEEVHYRLQKRAAELGVVFFSTAFDARSIDFLESLDLPVWKIPSGEITNYPYLARIAGMRRPTILSTGMANLGEIEAALTVLLEHGLTRDQICVLHCNTAYPTPWKDVNLAAMGTIERAFGCAIGYSDHTAKVEISIAAVALGARVIEKHFTLDKDLPGPDHKASLDPIELRDWVSGCRNVEVAIGDGLKQPSASEIMNRDVVRKIVVAARPITAGETLGPENLTVKRAGKGISPMEWPNLMGRAAAHDYAPDEPIKP